MNKAETQKYVLQLQTAIREKDVLITSLKAENQRLRMRLKDMAFLVNNPDGAIDKHVKESECKEDAVV